MGQLRKWFTRTELRNLARLGFKIKKFKVPYAVVSNCQCVFERHKAILVGEQ